MTAKSFTKALYYQRFIGITLIVLGIPICIVSNAEGATNVLLSGLFVLFTSSERTMDERSMSLKTTSIYMAIIISYVFKVVSSELVKQHISPYELTNINHFLIMIFAIANGLYFSRLYISINRE